MIYVDHTAIGTKSGHLNTLKKEIVYLHSAVYLIDRYYVHGLLWCYSWAILQTLNGKDLACMWNYLLEHKELQRFEGGQPVRKIAFLWCEGSKLRGKHVFVLQKKEEKTERKASFSFRGRYICEGGTTTSYATGKPDLLYLEPTVYTPQKQASTKRQVVCQKKDLCNDVE